MKIALTSALLLSTAHAFAPSKSRQVVGQALKAELNGWTPDESKFCYGLPGSLAPAGEFDPLGFAAGADLDTIKRYREAEGTSQGCMLFLFFWMRIADVVDTIRRTTAKRFVDVLSTHDTLPMNHATPFLILRLTFSSLRFPSSNSSTRTCCHVGRPWFPNHR